MNEHMNEQMDGRMNVWMKEWTEEMNKWLKNEWNVVFTCKWLINYSQETSEHVKHLNEMQLMHEQAKKKKKWIYVHIGDKMDS